MDKTTKTKEILKKIMAITLSMCKNADADVSKKSIEINKIAHRHYVELERTKSNSDL